MPPSFSIIITRQLREHYIACPSSILLLASAMSVNLQLDKNSAFRGKGLSQVFSTSRTLSWSPASHGALMNSLCFFILTCFVSLFTALPLKINSTPQKEALKPQSRAGWGTMPAGHHTCAKAVPASLCWRDSTAIFSSLPACSSYVLPWLRALQGSRPLENSPELSSHPAASRASPGTGGPFSPALYTKPEG